ncbi:sigma-70 family RNA polymerase sigma factor [Seonamhaeicola algicola]|uniref:RNA polymerase sigma factor n=1 Tax=Seonamhaeicola algicola TaxID=1719036 RepID=A0A5C7ANT7_9FLAO|nr:sigma-70 family RNA polymerase sigma factor [Seonamhaeicola algicola]TXE10001.1 sigma-70 family RNA polymerase sigma factor [Seonamhaeicola algicola]
MQLETLVKNFQNKDEQAFEALYNMYSQSIHGVVFNILKNDDLADEITQDVFIKAWDKAHTYNSSKGRFFTWILNIARNAAIDKTRSKNFKKNKQNLNADFFVNIIEASDNLDNKTDAIGIKTFVSKLADNCKKLINLLYFKGYTQNEASETLNMPIGTIKTRNRNCIKALRELVLN